MKRLGPLVLLFLAGALPAAAAEVDHLEFVRGLRARGYPDLAQEYLTELGKQAGLPAALRQQLPFEMARTLLDLATAETDGRRQDALYQQTRQQLEAFIQANPASPQAYEASLELARILVQQAKGRLRRAAREDGGPRPEDLRQIRTLFAEAGQRLRAAAKQIGAAAAKTNDPALVQARNDAELEVAVNLLDQMGTFAGEAEVERRVDLGKQALDALKKLASLEEKDRDCWLARAWLVRYYDEVDSFQEATDIYRKFDRAQGPAVEPGRRLARWHYLRLLARKDPNHNDRHNRTELLRLANEWLNDYRRYSRTPEGQGVRYTLAQAYRFDADALGGPRVPKALEEYLTAEKLYAALEREDGEYAERARLHKIQVMVKRRPELADGDIARLQSFEECFLRAQVEAEKMNEEAKNPPADAKKAEAQRTQHVRNIVDVLKRGLAKAGPKDGPKEQIDARFLLEYHLLLANQPAEAAKVGEELARAHPESSRAGSAGAYALYGLAQLLADQEKAGDPQNVDQTRDRLVKLARYVETTWPRDVAADAARHQLGVLALRQRQYADAVNALGRVTPRFASYLQAQFQLATAALQAHKEKVPPPPGQPAWDQQAAAAYRRIGEPPPGDVESNRVYVAAKLELAKIEYAAKDFAAMETLLGKLTQRLNVEKDAKVQEEQKHAINTLLVYAKYGKADAEFRSGKVDRFEKTRALLDPVVDQLKAKQLPAPDPKLVRAILGLALRANVLDGKADRAKEILALLQGSAGDFENQSAVLMELVQQLRGQIEELKQKGPSFDKEREKTVAEFTKFLNELAAQPQNLKPDMIRFLALSFSGFDQHAEAAALLGKLPAPQKPEEAKFYAETRVLHVHELRLAKKYAEAEAALRAFQQTDAGKRSLGARKEEAALLEDQEKFDRAANAWNRNLTDLRKLRETNPQLNESYHDCLYHYILCMYRFAAHASDDALKRKYTHRAAQLLASYERGDPQMGGFKDRYQELLQKEPPLKAEYEAAKAAQKQGTP